jgi:hypothetical protein
MFAIQAIVGVGLGCVEKPSGRAGVAKVYTALDILS